MRRSGRRFAAADTWPVLRLDAGRWTIVVTHAGDVTVRAEPFDAIEFDIGELWVD